MRLKVGRLGGWSREVLLDVSYYSQIIVVQLLGAMVLVDDDFLLIIGEVYSTVLPSTPLNIAPSFDEQSWFEGTSYHC